MDPKDLAKKAKEKLGMPASNTGKSLGAITAKLKQLNRTKAPEENKEPVATAAIESPAPGVTPGPTVDQTPLIAEASTVSQEVVLPEQRTANQESGAVSLEDLWEGRFSKFQMYLLPHSWLDRRDLKRKGNETQTYNRKPIEFLEKEPSFVELVESMKAYGQKVPGVVRVVKGQLLVITDGWRRSLAGEIAGLPYYLCIITDGTEEDAAFDALGLNLLREDLPEANKLMKIKELQEKYHATMDEISKRTGFGNKSYISQCLAIYDFPIVEKYFNEEKLTMSQAREIVIRAKREKYSAKEIESIAKAVWKKEIQLKELSFVEVKEGKAKVKAPTVPAYAPKEDGSFKLAAIHYNPKVWKAGEIEKTVTHLENVIKVLKKELKEKQK